MILVFTACGLCNKATFIGDEIADTDFYVVDFEQMNSTHSHNIDMDAGESIKVKIISKSGKISVQIYNEDDQPVYRGDDVTDAEFEIPSKWRWFHLHIRDQGRCQDSTEIH